MNIEVNNVLTDVPEGTTVANLIALQELPTGGLAVAVSDELVVRGRWSEHVLREGDKVLIIKAAYGG